ncbi:hypothetical protein FXN80_15060 [Dickeya fangzhongdai]|uniref:hypothetical protein n=1 Tax=Dickeya fangzhongdai TaxID=1778540 RepID=UPI00137221F8|nr:hypothetical protein [Dickeya fangzhongdai]UMB75426.1 hypothetical protein FXN80_15060 [Dickeya fangzhongdai]
MERILSVANDCDGKPTYNITYDAAGKTPLLIGKRIYNSAGHSSEIGKQSSATNGDIAHLVNNLFDSNSKIRCSPRWMPISAHSSLDCPHTDRRSCPIVWNTTRRFGAGQPVGCTTA